MPTFPRPLPPLPEPQAREPLSLRSRASDDLRFIRRTMERAAAFTAVPGWGGVLMGLVALLAAPTAAAAGSRTAWLLTWLGAATLALLVGASDMASKARTSDGSLLRGPASRFAMGLVPAFAAAACLTVVLWRAGSFELLPGTWLLLYGAGVAAGGLFSTRAVRAMGLAFMVLGFVALLTAPSFGDAWMALGFGGLHVVFGVWIARHPHGPGS